MLLTRMRGDGLHDQHSPLQRCIIEAAAPLIDYAAIRVPIPPKRAFSIVDYGCSEGRNSVDSVRKIIHSVLEREPQKWISVLHNDLPHNDFNTLFGNLYASEQASYLSKADERYTGSKVFAFVSGASFYGRVSPDESVDFAISSCATHWLSSLPDYAIPNHIYHGCASKEDTEKISRRHRLAQIPGSAGRRAGTGGTIGADHGCPNSAARWARPHSRAQYHGSDE